MQPLPESVKFAQHGGTQRTRSRAVALETDTAGRCHAKLMTCPGAVGSHAENEKLHRRRPLTLTAGQGTYPPQNYPSEHQHTDRHTSKGGRLLRFLLTELPLPSLSAGPLFLGDGSVLVHALGLQARPGSAARPKQIGDAPTIQEERRSCVHTPDLGDSFNFLRSGLQTLRNDSVTHADPTVPQSGGRVTQTLSYQTENANG